jgi:hypothetical protein
MHWLFALAVIAVLVAFNLYAADSMTRMRRDVAEIHRAVVVPASSAAKTASSVPSSVQSSGPSTPPPAQDQVTPATQK